MSEAAKTEPFHEEILLLAEKLGEVADRLGRIEAERDTQTAPLDAAAGAQASALKSLEAALVGIKALNFHVLENNLGGVSSRLSEVEKQADAAIRALEVKIGETSKALHTLARETVKHLDAVNGARHELAARHGADAADFVGRIEAVRGEISGRQTQLDGRIEAARKEFATPATLNPSGKYVPNRLYKRLDLVEWNGSSFVSTADDNDEQPGARAKKWQTVARRGASGAASGGGGTGDLAGPASATDNALARFDGTTGKIVQNSVILIADTTGAMSGWTTGAGLTFHDGGTLTGASGALTLAASGTNQNVTLTPSGTGAVATVANIKLGVVASTSTATPNYLTAGGTYYNSDTIAAAAVKVRAYENGTNVSGIGVTSGKTFLNAALGTPLIFSGDFVEWGRFALTTGNLLLGGLTTDGTGVLQLPGTTADIGFGATALAKIGLSANTTAGVMTFTAPSAGTYNFETAVGTTFAGIIGLGATSGDASIYTQVSTLTGAAQYGIYTNVTFNSAATTRGVGIRSSFKTAASAFTMASGYGFYAQTPTIGTGSAVTTGKGVYIENQGATGITNAYGIDIAAQSGAATTNVGLRNAGSTLLTNATASTTTTTGALIVTGGVASGDYFTGKFRTAAGTAGANFGPAAVASITVVDGIITAIS